MKEYRKNDVLEKLKEAFEAGLKRARLTERHGLVPGTPARSESGEWLLPFEDLNAAWVDFWRERAAFLWVLKRYHEERGRDVPERARMAFDALMKRLDGVFCEEVLREEFEGAFDLVDDAVKDDSQMEFDF